MADAVALASVVTSGVIAAGSLLATYISARQQRRHEAGQAFEQRIWEEKRRVLIELISACRALLDQLPDDWGDGDAAVGVSRARSEFVSLAGGIEAYASEACRNQFVKVQGVLARTGVLFGVHLHVDESRMEKQRAIDAQDFEAAARARGAEQTALGTAMGTSTGPLDRELLRREVTELLDQSRASLRRSD